MIITEDPQLRDAAIAQLRIEYGMDNQRPGMHQSELSYCLTKTFHDRTDPEPPTDKEVMLFSIGFGMERVLLHSEPTPPEVVIDGITMSLDTIDLFGPIDLKTTRMSPNGRKGEEGFAWPEGWKRQMAAYAYAMGVTEFGVVVVHLIQPEITAWRVHYSHQDLEDNWARLLTRRDQLESMLAANDSMPFQFNEDWECKNCRYLMRCQLKGSLDELMLR